MKNKCLYFGKNSKNCLIGMKIRLRAHDEKEEEEDFTPKSFNKSAENFPDYMLDLIDIIIPEKESGNLYKYSTIEV